MYHRTKDGKQMLISDMTDDHLINTVKSFVRQKRNRSNYTPYLAELLLRSGAFQSLTKELITLRGGNEESQQEELFDSMLRQEINSAFGCNDWWKD